MITSRSKVLRAVTFVQELRKDCARFTALPKRHPLLPRYRSSGIRRRVYGRYLIFYRIQEDTVQIIHILHGAMDYEAILFPETKGVDSYKDLTPRMGVAYDVFGNGKTALKLNVGKHL